MNFAFSEEQESIRALAREILEAEAVPERVKAAESDPHWIDEALWQKLAEANLLGIALPESAGGMEMGFAELCILLEEVGRAVAPLPVWPSLVLAGLPLAVFGTEAQRRTWLPPLASGEVLLSAALQDRHGADPAAPATRAEAAGPGFRLRGHKSAVPLARRAARVLVPASAPDGVALFLVDPGAPGLSWTPRRISTGEPLSELSLDGVEVAADARLGGPEADGAAILRFVMDRALVAVAALQVGVSERALEITADYAREREQFGTPIGTFQAVQHRCADAFIDLEALRWTTWRAAWRLGAGLDAAREARVAKFWAAEAGARIAGAALHLHGGLGSDVDYPIHRYFLWSRALELCLGGATAQLVELGHDMARHGPREAA